MPRRQRQRLAALRREIEALKQSAGEVSQQAVQAGVQAGVQAAEAAAKQAVGQQSAAVAAEMKALSETGRSVALQTLHEASISRLLAALDSGQPFAAAVPTLHSLSQSFPEAARQGLEAALVANMGNSWSERATNFLRAQTGARSLSPREGNDPDAILSRAEAALGRGDASAALAEVEALPEPAKQAMSGWIAAAQLRLEAEKAVAGLVRQIGAK
jgi:hypothetical protein